MCDVQRVHRGKYAESNGGKGSTRQMKEVAFRKTGASVPNDGVHGIEYQRNEYEKDGGLKSKESRQKTGGVGKALCNDPVKIISEQKDDCGGEEHGDEADGIEKRIKSASEKSPFSFDSVHGLETVADGGDPF